MLGGIFVVLVSFFVYLRTICPSVYVGDAGELISAVYNLGIPHPPGYPLFCIIGKLFTFIPLGDIAFRVNLMNAFLSSMSGLFIYLALLKILKFSKVGLMTTVLPAVCASLCLNFSNTLWSQAVIAEVYPLNTFFVSILIYLLVQWYETSKNNILCLISFLYAISLGNHNTMMLLGPVIVVWVILCRPQILKERKNLLLISVLFLLGLLIYLYLPIRASISPKVNWGNPDNLERFLDHVRRRQYGKLSKDSRTISLFFQQIWEYIKLIGKEFSPFLGLISIAGIICLYKTHKKYFILTVSLFLILSVGFIFLLNFKITAASVMSVSEFFTASYIIFAIWFGIGLKFLIEKISNKRIFNFAAIIVLFFPLIPLKLNYFENDRHKHYMAYDYGGCLLAALPENSIIIASGDNSMFSLSYLLQVKNMRPDVIAYDDSGYIFPNIYGDGFIKMADMEQDKKRVLIQKQKIYELNRPAYYTLENTKHDMAGITLEPVGLLNRVVEKKGDFKDKKDYWQLYKFRGIYDKNIQKDYITRNMVSQYLYQLGDYYYKKGELNKANESFRISGEIGYDNEWVQSNLGILLMDKGMSDGAIESCKKAVGINPGSAEAHLNLGTAYDNKGMIEEAIAEYKKAIELKTNYSSAYFNLGNAYMTKGLLKQAVEEYCKSLSINPNSVEAHINLGNAYDNLQLQDAAIEEYKRALTLNSNSGEARINLGTTYFNKGLKEEAMQEYKRAIEIMPDSVEAHFNLGNVYLIKGGLQEAMNEYKKVISINPKYIAGYYNLGVIYQKLGNLNMALSCWKQTLKIDPKYAPAIQSIQKFEGK